MIGWSQNVVSRAGDENGEGEGGGEGAGDGEDESKVEYRCRDTLHATYKCYATVMLFLLIMLSFQYSIWAVKYIHFCLHFEG